MRYTSTEFFSPTFRLNTGKYGPEISPYLDTFHAVMDIHIYIHHRSENGVV